MCSFLLVSWVLRNLAVINTYLKSRGPDATSLYRNERFELLFNHLHMTGAERLQPLFLSSAEQGNEQHAHVEKKEQEGELFATFNGEIYNWAELRDEHADAFRSESFKIRSDGDVILPLYKKYGPAFLKLLDGEFAIVVVDQQRGRIVVSTDVFGTKPLYVATYPGPDRGPAVGQENQANAVPVSAPEAAATTHFGVSVYRSGLARSGAPAASIRMLPPNRALVFGFGGDIEGAGERDEGKHSTTSTFADLHAQLDAIVPPHQADEVKDGEGVAESVSPRTGAAASTTSTYTNARFPSTKELAEQRARLASEAPGPPASSSQEERDFIAETPPDVSHLSTAPGAGSPAPDDAQKPRKSLGLPNLRLLDSFPLFEFDLRQYKTTTGDAVAAFEKAIRKRVRTSLHPPFLGLSSGYDAGAVHLALTKEKIPHYYYTIMGKEDMQIVERRNEFADANSYGTIIDYSYNMFQQVRTYLMACAESYEFTPFSRKHVGRTTVVDDDASMGLAQIMGVARQMGTLVYLTGSGADEVLSDYGFNGTRIFPQSTTGGRFPDNLAEVFPWRIFFLGTMRDYIMKEELVGGAFGIEARYPFLDKEFVQETLWLAAELKNSEYKKVLHDFFEQNAYPFKHRDKTGFSSAENRILSPQSLVYEMTDYFAHGIEKAKIVDPINVELVVSTAREGVRAGGASRKTQQAPAEEDEERPRRIGGASSDLSVLQNHKHAFQKRQKERMLSQQVGYTRRYWGLDTLSEGDFGRDLFVSFYTPLLQIEKDTSDVCWKDFNGYAIHIMNDDYLRERERIEREEDDKEFFDVRGGGTRNMVGGGGGEGARGPRADTYSSMNYTVLSEVGTESAANAVFNGESEVAEKMLESEMNKEGGGGPVTLPQGGGAHHQQLYVDPVVHRDPGDNFFRSVGYWAGRLLDDFAFLRSLLQPHLGALMQEQDTALHVKRELNEGLKILVVDAEPDVERKGFAVTERLVDSLPHSMQLHTIEFEIESPVGQGEASEDSAKPAEAEPEADVYDVGSAFFAFAEQVGMEYRNIIPPESDGATDAAEAEFLFGLLGFFTEKIEEAKRRFRLRTRLSRELAEHGKWHNVPEQDEAAADGPVAPQLLLDLPGGKTIDALQFFAAFAEFSLLFFTSTSASTSSSSGVGAAVNVVNDEKVLLLDANRVMFHRHGCGTRRNLVNSFLNLGLGEKIVVPAGLPTDPHPEILEACPLFQWPQEGAQDHSGSTGGTGNQRKTLEARFNAIDFPSAGAVGPGSKSNEDSSADTSSSSPMCGNYFRREKFAAYQDGRQDIRMPHFSTHYNMPQEGFVFGRVSLLKKLLLFIKTWKRFAAENCQAIHRVPIRESDLGAAGAPPADRLYSEDPDAQKEHRRKDVTVRGMVRRRRGFRLESSGEDTGASSPILAVRHASLDYRCKTSFLLHLYFLLNPEEIELDYEGALIMTIDGFTNHIWHQDYGLLYITWDHLLCFSTGSEAFRSSRELLYDYWDQYGAVELPTEKRREYFQRLQAYDEVGRVRWQQALDFDNQLRRMFGINQEVGEEEVHDRGKGGFNLASDLELGKEILTQIRARI